VACSHLVATNSSGIDPTGACLGPPRRVFDVPCTPVGMDTDTPSAPAPTMTLSELAAYLSVSTQALYDLRSKGRGPRGFRVGRQLRFRAAEIEACIAAMESADGRRHRPRSGT